MTSFFVAPDCINRRICYLVIEIQQGKIGVGDLSANDCSDRLLRPGD